MKFNMPYTLTGKHNLHINWQNNKMYRFYIQLRMYLDFYYLGGWMSAQFTGQNSSSAVGGSSVETII